MKQGEIPQVKAFYIPKGTKQMLAAAIAMAKEHPVNVLVMGKQGCGKTELGMQLAARLKRPYYNFQMGLLAESGQLLGCYVWKDGKMIFQPHQFLTAIQTKRAFIGLDEINRVEHPKDANALMNLLDDIRSTWVDELQQDIHVADNIIFFATINEGYEFTGTSNMDAALRDRFFTVNMEWLPMDKEAELLQKRTGIAPDIASKLAEIYHSARKKDVSISTRQGLAVADAISHGLPLEAAFEFVLNMDRGQLEQILISLHFKDAEESIMVEEWEEL